MFVNWITPSMAVMDYDHCFPQYKMVYIFLKYFFSEHFSNDNAQCLQYLSKKQNNWDETQWTKMVNSTK